MYVLLLTNDETGEEVEVEYTVSGGYHRATLYDPAEYPEVEFIDPLPAWACASRAEEQALDEAMQGAAEDEAEARAEYMADRDYW